MESATLELLKKEEVRCCCDVASPLAIIIPTGELFREVYSNKSVCILYTTSLGI